MTKQEFAYHCGVEMCYFPMTIMYTDTGELTVVTCPDDIETGRGFIVKQVSHD